MAAALATAISVRAIIMVSIGRFRAEFYRMRGIPPATCKGCSSCKGCSCCVGPLTRRFDGPRISPPQETRIAAALIAPSWRTRERHSGHIVSASCPQWQFVPILARAFRCDLAAHAALAESEMPVVVDGGTIGERSGTDEASGCRRTTFVKQRCWANLRRVDDHAKEVALEMAVNRETRAAIPTARAMEAHFVAPSTLRTSVA